MLIRSDLRAGGLLSNTSQTACDLCNQTTGYIKVAEQEAGSVASGLSKASTKFLNCVDKTFNQ